MSSSDTEPTSCGSVYLVPSELPAVVVDVQLAQAKINTSTSWQGVLRGTVVYKYYGSNSLLSDWM